jgi:quercetin 2,3-dioxygenase
MNNYRKISKILTSKPTSDGAGVKLNRVFGYYEVPLLDPFLLLDDFGSDNPDDYIAGFPMHPHRGIETVTYMLSGEVEHSDSMDNKGIIKSGDVQWMTAGSGIIHQEMPERVEGKMRGFQLWLNLPAKHKMMAPRYQEVSSEQIPDFSPATGVQVKVICGEMDGIKGPVQELVVDAEYLDISIESNTQFVKSIPKGNKVFAYVYEGKGYFDPEKETLAQKGQLVIFEDGEKVKVQTANDPVRLLLISGKPLSEPVAWRGPIVMNMDEELRVAFKEYHDGTFIKK